VSGPAPITTKVTLCASCHAELPFKAVRCPTCGAPRTELRRTLVPIVSALQAAAAVDAPPTVPAPPAVGTSAGFRFGIGFALGALVIAALAWLAINAAQGAGGDIAFDISIGSPTVVTFSGSGSATSGPFRLRGDVDVDWTARPGSPAGCRMRAVLRVASTPSEYQVLVDGETLTETSRTQGLQALIDNDYVIDVASDCAWSFRFKPRP
jgi:hypothetical protein